MKLLNVAALVFLTILSIESNASVCENQDFYKNEFDRVESLDKAQTLKPNVLLKEIPTLRKFAAASINTICLPSEADAQQALKSDLSALADALGHAQATDSMKVIDRSKLEIAKDGAKLSALFHRPNRALELKPVFAILNQAVSGDKTVSVVCLTERDDGAPIDHGYFSTKISVECKIEKSTTLRRGKRCEDFSQRSELITLIFTPADGEKDAAIQMISYDTSVNGAECGPGA